MSFVTFDESDNPLIAAENKISSEYVLDNGGMVSEIAQQQMTIAAFHHGDFCRQVTWSPNWEQVGQRTFPSGFQFDVHETAPVIAPLFENAPLYAVSMAFPLEAGHASELSARTGMKIGEAYFASPSNGVGASLLTAAIDERLGAHDTNFSGIFSTQTRTDSGYQTKLWCVTQAHSDEVSARMHDMIASAAPQDLEASLLFGHKLAKNNYVYDPAVVGMAAPPHTTWKQLFAGDEDFRKLAFKQRQHCGKVMLSTLKAAGLGTVAHSPKGADNLMTLLHNPRLVEARRNCVDHVVDGGDTLAYLSDMTSRHAISSTGTIVREAPQLGPTILPGPFLANNSALKKGVIGFPCSVGRFRSVHAHNLDSALKLDELVQNGTHIWDASKAALNTNLSTTLHRKRTTAEWQQCEAALGFDQTLQEVNLRPVLVLSAITEQPRMK